MKPGDVVVGAFPGADATKVRPAVVLSAELYHRHRPDVIVGLVTTQPPKRTGSYRLRIARLAAGGASSAVLLQIVSRHVAAERRSLNRKAF